MNDGQTAFFGENRQDEAFDLALGVVTGDLRILFYGRGPDFGRITAARCQSLRSARLAQRLDVARGVCFFHLGFRAGSSSDHCCFGEHDSLSADLDD